MNMIASQLAGQEYAKKVCVTTELMTKDRNIYRTFCLMQLEMESPGFDSWQLQYFTSMCLSMKRQHNSWGEGKSLISCVIMCVYNYRVC